jgi:flavin reductase ActVB
MTERANGMTPGYVQHRWIHAHDAPEEFSSAFRESMSRFPSGVTIVTTQDRAGTDWGFTASAFCSLSMAPPLVLVCLVNSADCHMAFRTAKRWVINILAYGQADLAMRFATKGEDKFSGDEFDQMADGLPILRDAAVSVVCEAYERHPGGDHVILVGKVAGVSLRDREPLVHHARGFPRLSS